jgi:endogenous inhibitor of DNA gyrase (YacG/DUF329 family)
VLFDDAFVGAPCPRCGYEFDVQIIDVRIERRVHCPNCKVAVDLRDESASMYGAQAEAEAAIGSILRTLGD